MKRLVLTLLATCVLGFAALVPASRAQAPTTPGLAQSSNNVDSPEALRQLLVNGLKATRADERKYLDQVVARVVDKTLPLSIVYASFRYARTRRPSYPFPYFVYSVETLAKRNRN